MNKNTVIIGDIHGLTVWKKIVADNPHCRYVFLGDYLDPYEQPNQQPASSELLIQNLSEIIQFKKDNPENVILLFGNHDLHYFTDDICQSSRFDIRVVEKASVLFSLNFDCFRYAYQAENYIFTHAGISHDWFIHDFRGDISKDIARQLNRPSNEQIKALCQLSEYRGGNLGDRGGIFWADVQDLDDPLHGYTQIVGHNRMDEISEYRSEYGKIIFCDTLRNGQYLKIENKNFVINKIND